MQPTLSRFLLTAIPLFLLAQGCPKRVTTVIEEEPDPIAAVPVDDALLAIARHEQARDAGSEVVPFVRHPDTGVRVAALRALGRMGHPEALQPIAFRLQDPVPVVRDEAAFALGLSWAWDVDDDAARLLLEDRIEEVLSGALDQERDPETRGAIARAMGNGAGASAWHPLEGMLLQGDRGERIAALEGMAMLGRRGIAQPVSDTILDPLLPALVIDDSQVQWWCAYLLLRCPLAGDEAVRERAHQALVQAAEGTADPRLRAVLARALGSVAHPDAAAAIEALASRPEATSAERVAAARGLGALLARRPEDAALVESLCRLAADAEPFVRESSAVALGGTGAEHAATAAEALLPLTTDPDPAVRAASLEALAGLELSGRAMLLDALEPDPVLWVEASRLAARISMGFDEDWFESNLGQLVDREPVVKLAVFGAMAQQPENHPYRAALLWAVSGDDPSLAVIAVDALAGDEDPQARATLIESYDRWTGFAGAEVREHLIDAMNDGQPVPPGWFDAALEDPQRPVRRAAARAIRETGRHVVAHPDPMPDLADPLHGTDGVTGARIETERGTIAVELFPLLAPATVASFVKLSEAGSYDGLTFHRVVPAFVIQGGCPDDTGWGGPGYTIRSEFNGLAYEPGTLGMARSAVDTEGSQWFITHDRQPHLTGHYTAFGRVTGGMDVLHAIRRGDHIVGVSIMRAETPADPE